MANDYDYERDRERERERERDRNRYGRGSYGRYGSEREGRYESGPYEGSSSDDPYYRGSGSRSYNEPYSNRSSDEYYSEPYGSYDEGRYETRRRYNEPFRRGSSYEGRSDERYDRSRYGREAETRSLLQRIEDEIKSWFGDEDAERRRRADEMRTRNHAGRGPRNYRRSDERIREDLNERLTEDPYLDASNIDLMVESCVVTMTGTVNTRYEKRRAADLAESVSGVTDINNQLRITQTPSTILPELNTPTQTKSARS